GEINVQTATGEGALFSITIPFGKGEDPRHGDNTEMKLAGKQIAVVTENARTKEMLTEHLRCWKCKVDKKEMSGSDIRNGAAAHGLQQDDVADAIIVESSLVQKVEKIFDKNSEAVRSKTVILKDFAETTAMPRTGNDHFTTATVQKPVRKKYLRTALLEACCENRSPGNACRHEQTREIEITRKKTHVLLVEDNETNQKVVLFMLNKLGCAVELAGNGKEAIRLLQQQPFDIVFMDIQMPVMDGIEATAAIRNSSMLPSEYRSVPIVAMTAHAREDDRRQCAETGMNGYITKPVTPEKLKEAMNYISNDKGISVSRKPLKKTSIIEREIFDAPVFFSRLENDTELIWRVLTVFLKDIPGQVRILWDAVSSVDCAAVEKQAHKIKGACRNVEARALASVAEQLQEAGHSANLSRITALIDRLELEFRVLKIILMSIDPARMISFGRERIDENACCGR
ncbi:MAG: response regulator, partial [Chitinivibrionales bacterium]|nr:response regulator [Chitinivibrionales bacterium]